jgi:parvulin-like peptidyl-prolyl isomerase
MVMDSAQNFQFRRIDTTMQRILFTPLLIGSLVLSSAHAADNDVVAKLGNTTLTLGEVKQLTAQVPDLGKVNPQELDRLIRTEIVRKELVSEARRKGFDKSPEATARMNLAADQALVAAYMNSLSRPPADYPSDAEVKQAYESHKEAFVAQTQYHLAQIFVPGKDGKAAAEAEDVYRQASRKDADFAKLASTLSKHAPSAERGGDMGWVSEKNLMPAIGAAISQLDQGGVAKPVLADDGYHVVKLLEKKPARPLSFDEVKSYLAQTLRLQRARENEAHYLDNLVAKNPVEINGIALSELRKGN